MNYVFAFIEKADYDTAVEIFTELETPLILLSFSARGTAVKSMRDLLGIEDTKKRLLCAFADRDKTKELIRQLKRRIYIGVPGHGIVAAVPIKSVGGGKVVEQLKGNAETAKYTPDGSYAYELIVVIANEGQTDAVMNAARAAGAAGGTTLHARGTGSSGETRFMNVSISSEKEVLFIVARSEKKAGIMRAILEKAGPGTDAGAIVFSLPVSEAAGFGVFEE